MVARGFFPPLLKSQRGFLLNFFFLSYFSSRVSSRIFKMQFYYDLCPLEVFSNRVDKLKSVNILLWYEGKKVGDLRLETKNYKIKIREKTLMRQKKYP